MHPDIGIQSVGAGIDNDGVVADAANRSTIRDVVWIVVRQPSEAGATRCDE